MYDILQQRLSQQKQQQRWRERRALIPHTQGLIQYQGKNYLSFSSNDYLGLAKHLSVISALQKSSTHYGVGSTSSALIAGYTEAHQNLENEFAYFTGRDRAILFGSGTMANFGIITALMQQRTDTIYQDKLNHASLIDAARLSQAQLIRYPHHQLEQLENALQKPSEGLRLIVSESVFSMDGSEAKLNELAKLSKNYNALLMIDDAHGIGVMGKEGKSVAAHLTQDECDLIVCPLGKAFGGYGALVAGSELLIESLVQFARSYIYTTALPPCLAAAASSALSLIQNEEWRREKLQQLIAYFKKSAAQHGLALLDSNTPIQSIVIGDAQHAQQLSQALLKLGIYVRDIRPPTVPEGTARLRISLTVEHSEEDVDCLMKALTQIELI